MMCHEMSAVSQFVSFLSDFAGGIPEVWNVWFRREGTTLHGARDVSVGAGAAESAFPMPWPARQVKNIYRSADLSTILHAVYITHM